jgi:cytoskeletal protein CcmA (bactofilin family)
VALSEQTKELTMFERKSNKPESRDPDPAPAAATPSVAAKPIPTPNTRAGARAMIGSKVKVNGDIVSSEDLLVEGEVTGTITLTDNELVVGTSGRVQANITAKTVRIEGEVSGDIDSSERVVICASGNVQGNLKSPRVMLEDGGRFKGNIDMGSSKPAMATKPISADKPTTPTEMRSVDKAG